jgi:hypothetical protein
MLRQYMIRPSRGWNGPRFYKFEDVLAAAMLRHGRGGLADKMCVLASREDVKARVRRERWHSVWDVVSTKGVAEDYLTMSVVYPYAKDFVDTGRGGNPGLQTAHPSAPDVLVPRQQVHGERVALSEAPGAHQGLSPAAGVRADPEG